LKVPSVDPDLPGVGDNADRHDQHNRCDAEPDNRLSVHWLAMPTEEGANAGDGLKGFPLVAWHHVHGV
jgi:hypothetical protein